MNEQRSETATRIVTGVLVAGGLAALASTGSAATASSPTLSTSVSSQVSQMPVVVPEPEQFERAADKAEAMRRAEQRRARERAQRSSGQMFTPTRNFTYSAVFGQAGGWSSGYHTGLDFAAPSGTPVYSGLAGKVIEAGWGGAYGNNIRVRHADGVVTLYAHLTSIDVSVGDKVTRGQQIGTVGSTGNSTGPHLHFEVLERGTQVNPMSHL